MWLVVDAADHRVKIQRQRLICHAAHEALLLGRGGVVLMVSDLSNAAIPPALIVLML